MSLKSKLSALSRIITKPKKIDAAPKVTVPGSEPPEMGNMLDENNPHITDRDKQMHQMKMLRQMMKKSK